MFTHSHLNTRGGWENLRKLCEPDTQSRVCITFKKFPSLECLNEKMQTWEKVPYILWAKFSNNVTALQRKVNVKKDVFPSCHERGIKKNSEFPHEEDSSWRPRIFLYPTLVTRRKNIFLNFSSSSKLIISTIPIKGKRCLFNILMLND